MRVHQAALVVFALVTGCTEQPTHEVTAQVTSITPRVSRWYADQATVVFHSRNGVVGEKSLPIKLIRCEVGDKVLAWEQGLSLQLDGRACVNSLAPHK